MAQLATPGGAIPAASTTVANGQGAYFCNEYCASEEGRHDRCEGSSAACIAVRDPARTTFTRHVSVTLGR